MSEAGPRLGLALGGCLETATVPHHALRLLAAHPGLSLHFSVTRRALDFVTPTALEGLSKTPVYGPDDRFDPKQRQPFHLHGRELDLLVVYPATARLIAEMALGIPSCPVTRLVAFTAKPKILVTPYLHPAMEPALYQPHLAVLRRCGCQLVLPSRGTMWSTESAWDSTRRALGRRLRLAEAKEGSP